MSNNGWISVNEQLPDNDNEVLAFCGIPHKGKLIGTRYISRHSMQVGQWQFFNDNADCWEELECVTHWQSMPENPVF